MDGNEILRESFRNIPIWNAILKRKREEVPSGTFPDSSMPAPTPLEPFSMSKVGGDLYQDSVKHNAYVAQLQVTDLLHVMSDIPVVVVERSAGRLTCQLTSHAHKDSPKGLLAYLCTYKVPITLLSSGRQCPTQHTTTILTQEGAQFEIPNTLDLQLNSSYTLIYDTSATGDISLDRTSMALGSLLHNVERTPLAQSFFLASKDKPYVPPPVPLSIKYAFPFPAAFHNYRGPPGTGKSWTLSGHIEEASRTGHLVYVVAPTNAALAAISEHLVTRGVDHWNFINSDKRDLFKVDDHARFMDFKSFNMTTHPKKSHLDSNRRSVANFTSFSTVVLMTISRAFSRVDFLLKNRVEPVYLFVDEQGTVPFYKMMALMALNPQVCCVAGDDSQFPPYFELDPESLVHHRHISATLITLQATTKVLQLPSSCTTVLGNGTMRMPQPFTNVLGAIFYPDIYDRDIFVGSHNVECVTVSDEVSKTRASNVNETQFNYSGVQMVLTPFKAQSEYLKGNPPSGVPKPDSKVPASTLVQAQGLAWDHVVVDFVKRTNYKGVTDNAANVALSRFRKTLHVNACPKLPGEWFSGNYAYDPTMPLQHNLNVFLDNIRKSNYFEGLEQYKSFIIKANTIDLKWRFFVNLIFYLKGDDRFSKIVPRRPTFAMTLSALQTDRERFTLCLGHLELGSLLKEVRKSHFQNAYYYTQLKLAIDDRTLIPKLKQFDFGFPATPDKVIVTPAIFSLLVDYDCNLVPVPLSLRTIYKPGAMLEVQSQTNSFTCKISSILPAQRLRATAARLQSHRALPLPDGFLDHYKAFGGVSLLRVVKN
jgi:hypothetical protein